MIPDSSYERILRQYQLNLDKKVSIALENAIKDLSTYLARYSGKFPEDYAERITFIHRRGIQKELENQLKALQSEMSQLTEAGAKQSWDLAQNKYNILTHDFVAGISVPVSLTAVMFKNNQIALINYLENRAMISERVLNYTGLFQGQIESYLSSGIIQGKSAIEIARELTKIAIDPMKEYKAMKKITPFVEMPKPGAGVYLSVRKNMYRITRTEINNSFRQSGWEKRQSVPYVVGIEVHLSDAHPPAPDICDDMEGIYPKEFVFTGWHPQCICYETEILSTKEEFRSWIKAGMPKELNSVNSVKQIPVEAERYVLNHKDKLEKTYFYRDNFENGRPIQEVGGRRPDIML